MLLKKMTLEKMIKFLEANDIRYTLKNRKGNKVYPYSEKILQINDGDDMQNLAIIRHSGSGSVDIYFDYVTNIFRYIEISGDGY